MTTQRKIDNSLLKRFERKENSNSRKVNSKEKRVYFLIVCEGEETEPNYFKAFEKELPPYTLDIQTWGTGRDPLGVVNAAIELNKRSKKDSVWVVFDKDDFPAKNFNAAIKKAAANQIKCAGRTKPSNSGTSFIFNTWIPLFPATIINVFLKQKSTKKRIKERPRSSTIKTAKKCSSI